jgi:hypothetical protein
MRPVAFAALFLLAAQNAFAQTTPPLPPGKPAGVRNAMSEHSEGILLMGIVAVGAGVTALLVANAVKGSSSTATTSTSP